MRVYNILVKLVNLILEVTKTRRMKNMSTIGVPNSAIQGPPFQCPECSAKGLKVSFITRPRLGSHRLQHGVKGTSTGSLAYKTRTLNVRASTKTKFCANGCGNKVNKNNTTGICKSCRRGPMKSVRNSQSDNPLLSMVANPARTVKEIDAEVCNKQIQIDNLNQQVAELKNQIEILEKFRGVLHVANKQDVQMYAHTA
jgi:hypothetical protein